MNEKINNRNIPSFSLSDMFYDTWKEVVFEYSKTKKEVSSEYLKQIIKRNLINIKEIWNSFTVNRSELKSFTFNTPQYSLSYLIGFHIANATRLYQILSRIIDRYHVDFSSINIKNINIFDIGCGTGAMSSSFMDFILSFLINNLTKDLYSDLNLNINLNLMDRSSFFLKQAHTFNSNLFSKYNALYTPKIKMNIKDYKTPIESIGSSKIFQSIDKDSLNIFIVGYLYNEIVSKKKAGSIFHTLFQKQYIKNSKSLVIILDPANKTPSRNLMEFKNFIVQQNNYTPIYPCPFLKTQCPMLATSDWCYSELIFKKDSFQNFIDKSLKIDRSNLSTSAFCFVSDPIIPYIKTSSSPTSIVVGKPIIKADKTQKHIQYLLCNGQKLFKKDPSNTPPPLLKGEKYKK